MSSTDARTATTKDPAPEAGPAEPEASFASELDVTTALGAASRPEETDAAPAESPEAGQHDSGDREAGPDGRDPQTRPSARRKTGAKARVTDASTAATRRWWSRPERSALRGLPRITIAALLVAAVSLIVAAATVWRTGDAADELAALRAGLDTDTAAERVATDYALGVSRVEAGQVDAWREALTSGVTEQLAAKLTAAADVVGPWLTQMEYSATAKPLAAKVMSRDGDLHVVQVFVDMNSRSRQTPEGVVATAAYTVTLDRAADWTITDVGGVAPDLPVPTTEAPAAPR
ncbi:hypothetical protein [Nocardia shimofusensis]|uniref:hypothetical protein n=1 Tax=Nocardia shimofusensis TaxID=228596 RepID=UPI00082D1279|nr:hypothetical protein [Nocardia shimofusensis]